MCQKHKMINMGFTNEEFPAGTHMCLIYNNEEDRKKIISKFLKKGLSTGEKVAYLAEDVSKAKDWLSAIGIKLPNDTKPISFNITNTKEAYHPKGIFKPKEMLQVVKNFYETSIKEKKTATRSTSEMSWALKGVPGSDKLMEYESKLTILLEKYPTTVVCQYDANKFDGSSILECLKVHPYLIASGQIIRNPYYLSPEEYLNQKNN